MTRDTEDSPPDLGLCCSNRNTGLVSMAETWHGVGYWLQIAVGARNRMSSRKWFLGQAGWLEAQLTLCEHVICIVWGEA